MQSLDFSRARTNYPLGVGFTYIMPFTHTKSARSSLLMLLIGLPFWPQSSISSVYLARSTQSYFSDVVRLRDLRSSAADMMLLLRAAEAGQRGYLLQPRS